jgi:outer membrane protein OmpA-like peptidoglycan-associated protein
LVEEAFESTDSLALKVLDENAIPNISYQNRYFYNMDSKKGALDTVIVASDTLFVVKIDSDNKSENIEPAESITEKKGDEKTKYQNINIITGLSISFDKNAYKIDDKYVESLSELAHIAINNPNLYIKIIAYADKNEAHQIAITRATEIRSFLVDANLPIEKTNTIATINNTENTADGQRADVVIFESKQPLYQKGEFSSAVRLMNMSEPKELNLSSFSQKKSLTSPTQNLGEIVYKVQIAAGADYLQKDDAFFKGEEVSVYQHHHLYKYVIGHFDTSGAAFREQLRLIDKGFEGAFVVKFKNGKRID